MKLSVIIVSWNVREHLANCLRSIEKYRPCIEFEIIVVDNASSDGSVDCILHDFPEVIVIANKENHGFATANNQGIEKSRGQYLFFLNPDTIVHPHSLDILVEFMNKNKDVGACGPKLLNEDGRIHPSVRHFPTFRGALYRHTAFRFLGIFRREYKKWLMKDFDYDKEINVDQVMGAALMTRRSTLKKLGPMDEGFFIYYEEVDLCYRIKNGGWRVVFVPDAIITHLGGQSTRQIDVEARIMMLTSLLTFFRKHKGKFVTAIFNCVFKPSIILRDICNLVMDSIQYIFTTMALDKRKREESSIKVKKSAILLIKYSWRLIFKM